MKVLTEAEKEKIIQALRERGAEGPCPRCGTAQFGLVGGYFNPTMQTELAGLILGGPAFPVRWLSATSVGGWRSTRWALSVFSPRRRVRNEHHLTRGSATDHR
jgi:hypothetical protein